jgi:D-alanyl-D-alanine carboxypeptidase
MLNLGATIRRIYVTIARTCLVIAAVIAAAGFTSSLAEARHWRALHRHAWAHHHVGHWRHHRASINSRAKRSEANIAAIVVDGNSGKTLYARNENDQRFPASITKVMTLYLLFDELERGHLRLDSNIQISAFAAGQKPTRLGLRAGQSISVDDAIRAVVTRSANDIAVAIAEAIGGDEPHFAVLMTQKAHELGMTQTQFANASGLPNTGQLTTARDLALLGRAIQEQFPRYFRYFATRAFYFRHAAIVNHNHLLDQVEGMDGIKTGYTRASGFNLLASVKRDGHYIVAVVLGGSSARARDRIMAGLIEDHIESSATVRTAAPVVAANTELGSAEPRLSRSPETSKPASEGAHEPAIATDSSHPRSAVDPIRVASFGAGSVSASRPRPAFVPGAPKLQASENGAFRDSPSWQQARADGSTASGLPEERMTPATATPSPLPARPGDTRSQPGKFTNRIGPLPQIPGPGPEAVGDAMVAEGHGGWMIQIGATTDFNKAAELLTRARSKGPKTLTAARGFTEKIQKGSEIFYRARFAGLEEGTAALACKTLKRAGFSCFTTKN